MRSCQTLTRTVMSDALLNFACLDELIQLIYQGASKFVVLSRVDDDSWTVHLALSGSEGRWWRARWTEREILDGVVGLLAYSPSSRLTRQ